MEEHLDLIPDLAELVNDFKLDFALAFQIIRPKLNAAYERNRQEDRNRMEAKLAAEKERAAAEVQNSTSSEIAGLKSPLVSPSSPTLQFETLHGESEVNGTAGENTSHGVPPPKTASVSYPSSSAMLADKRAGQVLDSAQELARYHGSSFQPLAERSQRTHEVDLNVHCQVHGADRP
jgi:hypothetical protein